MENVKGLVTEKFRPFFFAWLKELESYGYTSYYRVLNAKDYGVPQNRERIFVISIRRDGEENFHYHFPKAEKLTLRIADILQDNEDKTLYYFQESVRRTYQKD